MLSLFSNANKSSVVDDQTSTIVKNYLDYILLSSAEDTDEKFEKGQSAVLKAVNFKTVLKEELCSGKFSVHYKERLRCFAKIDQTTDNEAHKRIKRLSELLETFSSDEKAALINNLGQTSDNYKYGHYLILSLLHSQIVTYEHEQESAKGAVRTFGKAAGISQSQTKAIFLEMLARRFAANYLNAGIANAFPEANNPTWMTLLKETLLPGQRMRAALTWLPTEFLQEIGITPDIFNGLKKDASAMGNEAQALFEIVRTKIVINLPNNLHLVRIKGKVDGKNTGYYDGTYVTQAAYQRQSERYQTNLKCYKEEEVYFLKMFPTGKKRVEGFAEAFVGRFIRNLNEKKCIPQEYQACFAPASIIELPNHAGPALLQPFTLGAQALYQVASPNSEKKPSTEEFISLMSGTGYQKYFPPGRSDLSNLAFIIMLMLLVGNYSVHSGNILVRSNDKNTIHQYTAIDYGAALRNLMGTDEQEDIWDPLEMQLGFLNSSGNGSARIDKYYISQYFAIPGFKELILDHAARFSKDQEPLLKSSVLSAVTETYEPYKMAIVNQYGRNPWNGPAKKELFEYILGSSDCYDSFQRQFDAMQPQENWENNEKMLLAKKISDVVITRLNKLVTLNNQSLEKTGLLTHSSSALYSNASQDKNNGNDESTIFAL